MGTLDPNLDLIKNFRLHLKEHDKVCDPKVDLRNIKLINTQINNFKDFSINTIVSELKYIIIAKYLYNFYNKSRKTKDSIISNITQAQNDLNELMVENCIFK